MRLKRFFIFIISLFVSCLSYTQDNVLPKPDGDGFVFFSADNATIEPNSKKVNLSGSVTVIQNTQDGKERKLVGENITFDQANTTITSVGPVVLSDNTGTQVTAKDIQVNYTTNNFTASNITTEYPPIHIIGAKEVSSKNGTQIIKHAEVTCCDNPNPHYTISVGKLKMSPEKRLFATNAVFKLDGFPILYLPVFWRSLDSQKPWTTYVEFTQGDKTGFGILTSSVFNPVLGLKPIIHLDYYTKSGFGFGGGLTAVESPTLRGSGEYYYINDKSPNKEDDLASTKRWGFEGGYWWEMYDSSNHLNEEKGALYQFQTQFRMVSDPYFNDSFFRSNPYIFMPDQETNFSLSRQTRKSTLRVSYQEKDIFSQSKKEFLAETRALPEVKYLIHPVNDPILKLAHRFEFGFSNVSSLQYNGSEYEEGSYEQQAHAKWTAQRAFRLAKNFTFTPNFFYDQTVDFKSKHYNEKDAWVGRIGSDLNFRTKAFLGDIDLGYKFTKRLSTGTLTTDHSAIDKGIELNKIYIQDYYRPSLNTYVRLESSFNLAQYTTDQTSGLQQEIGWNHLKQRVDPFIAELGYNSPNGVVHLMMQDQYDLENKNLNFIAQSNFVLQNHIIGLGLNNFADYEDAKTKVSTNADRYTVSTTWGIRPSSKKWFADLGIDASFFRGHIVGFNKLVRVSRDFHDSRLELTLRSRNHNLSFAFRFNILCGAGKGKKQPSRADSTEAYWYPWRSEGDLRD